MSDSKTVLITGASRGIGAAAARLFAKEGYGVGINYHTSRERAEALRDEIIAEGGRAACYGADISVHAEVTAMVEAFLEEFGHIDVLVCCAGVAGQQLFTDVTDQDWRRIMGTDLDGVFYSCQAALKDMIHRKSGRIITVSSMWGQVGASCEVVYSAAKAGVIGLTKALAQEVGLSGITVNCVAPGVIDTEMNAALTQEDLDALAEETPLGRIGTAEEAAQAIVFLASDKAGFITGQVLAPNGGFVI